jgi:hypothetical protein
LQTEYEQLQMPGQQIPVPALVVEHARLLTPLPTSSPPTKRKGFIIKNMALCKAPEAAAPASEQPASEEDREDGTRIGESPAEDNAPSPPKEALVDQAELTLYPAEGARSELMPSGGTPAHRGEVGDISPSVATSLPTVALEASEQKVLLPNLLPKSRVIDRQLMLRVWRLHPDDVHDAVKGLRTSLRPGETPQGNWRSPKPPVPGQGDHPAKPSRPAKPSLPTWSPSPNAYKPVRPTTRKDELERSVRALLNKICPDNLQTIVERLAQVSLETASELEIVISIIFQKALSEPHYSETYADMVFALRRRYPEFPPEHEWEKPHSFTRVLLNTCQHEFESLPMSLEPAEEERSMLSADGLRLFLKQRKDKVLANMKFIGNLFLRQLLAVKVVGRVVHDLIGIKEDLPQEHMIECACELLQAIGYTLDHTEQGSLLMGQFAARLRDLKRLTTYSKRVQFIVQDLLDLRENDWQKKLFKEQAMTRDEVRREAQKDLRMQGKGGGQITISTTTAGVRPAYIEELRSSNSDSASTGPAHPAKPIFDQAYVKRLFQYYVEEKSSDDLVADWNRASPSSEDVTRGAGWLVEIGYNDVSKEDAVAETVVELMRKRCIGWNNLREAISSGPIPLEEIHDFMMDVPTADRFFHSLLARLLVVDGLPFKSAFLKCLPSKREVSAGLLVGSMRRLKELGGTDAVRKALAMKDLASKFVDVKRCTLAGLQHEMQREGIL